MRGIIALCAGAFSVMALSNAIVPHLPSFAAGSSAQSVVFSAYFLGAFLFTLPAGIISDRLGPRLLILSGLTLTLLSGLLLLISTGYILLVCARLLEGFGAGLFVTAALTTVNQDPSHVRFSGFFMATLNTGLVVGIAGTGVLVSGSGEPRAGILVFSACTAVALTASIVSSITGHAYDRTPQEQHSGNSSPARARLISSLHSYFWLWFSSVVLVGITGAVTALYPGYTGQGADIMGISIAAMNFATIITVLLVAQARLDPVPAIRAGAAIEGISAMAALWTPYALVLLGAAAGVVMIAQLNYLAIHEVHQGTVVGLFTMASYGGMAVIPLLAGTVAEYISFPAAFGMNALLALAVIATIGRCGACQVRGTP